jgi:hypothetical protein
MALPEYVASIVAAGDLPALAFIVLKFGSEAVVRLVAGLAAIISSDTRTETCLTVLRTLRGKDDSPPSLPTGFTPEGAQQAPDSGASGS